jgi:hypothetical protein
LPSRITPAANPGTAVTSSSAVSLVRRNRSSGRLMSASAPISFVANAAGTAAVTVAAN